MGVLKRTEDLSYKENGFLVVDNSLLLDIFLESYSVDTLHNDKLYSVAVADVIHLDNIGMGKNSNRLGLILETTAKFLVRKKFFFKYFNGNDPVVDIVVCLIYDRHTSDTDYLLNFISAVKSFSNIIFHKQIPFLITHLR